jgi:hypothetical protein
MQATKKMYQLRNHHKSAGALLCFKLLSNTISLEIFKSLEIEGAGNSDNMQIHDCLFKHPFKADAYFSCP